jgi:ribonuclease HI
LTTVAKHYYAVRRGLVPGIYRSWDECKTQISGYPCAEYKGFDTEPEAEAYLAGGQAANAAVSEEKNPELNISGPYAFVDGSYNPKTKVAGYGVILVVDGVQMKMGGICGDPGSMRNVAGETTGAKVAVQSAISIGLKSLTIFHDYAGVAAWVTGAWGTKNPETAAYAADMKALMEQSGLELSFVHVNGHTGVDQNEEVDKLAKRAVGVKA